MRALAGLVLVTACGSSSVHDVPDAADTSDIDAPAELDAPAQLANRDRLLATYLAYLQAHPGAQSNGLDGAQLANVCQLWSALAPSGQAVFLTITARLESSIIETDSMPMLDHVTKLYRVVGGMGASASNAGSCGGGEYNRMIMSMDAVLHDQLGAAFDQSGGTAAQRIIVDAVATSFWRNSHDAAGPHTPFDRSCETEGGAPRGQVQYFHDPASAPAMGPLGRMDLATLVDPYALEMDQDYDCVHNSNPTCDYTFYGPACAVKPTKPGVEIYDETYGNVDLAWKPSGC
jgi:hypothetical protein